MGNDHACDVWPGQQLVGLHNDGHLLGSANGAAVDLKGTVAFDLCQVIELGDSIKQGLSVLGDGIVGSACGFRFVSGVCAVVHDRVGLVRLGLWTRWRCLCFILRFLRWCFWWLVENYVCVGSGRTPQVVLFCLRFYTCLASFPVVVVK